ncbi:MAG: SRPBCC domain-containing protein [Proteobacteria bacterium]|nr:SRPBCC domain-containing protein [Pseudomonadota bacterium]
MYTANVIYRLRSPRDKVWAFVSEPERLARWFANVDSFCADAPFRFVFGDGDFHNGDVIEWYDEIGFALRWQFLGLGPWYRIRFSLLPRKDDTELAISDHGAISLDEALCLRLGWTEFCVRLQRVLDGEGSARFDWRRDFNVTSRFRNRGAARALRDPGWYRQQFDAEIREVDESGGILLLDADRWTGVSTTVRIRQRLYRDGEYTEIQHDGFGDMNAACAKQERRAAASAWLTGLQTLGAY